MHEGRHKNWFEELQPSLNLTPLLDVVFNLIFFFILATTIKESPAFLNVSLPFSEQAQETKQKQSDMLIITVDKDNTVHIREQQVEAAVLEETLKQIVEIESIKEVIIRGDAKAYHQTIIRVLDACASVHLYKVSVEALPLASD